MKKYFPLIVLIVVAVGVVFSFDTNPLSGCQRTDSSVFQYIGYRMLEGKFPYRDVFDHKGLLLYFLNVLGCWLPVCGQWIIECLWFLLPFAFAYRKLSVYFGKHSTVIALTVFSAYYTWNSIGGNLTETYAAPLILLSLTLLICSVMEGMEHPWRCFIHGIVGVLLLMLRPNTVPICAVVAVYYVMLASKKRSWASFFRCSGWTLCGVAVAAIPFVTYLGITGLFKDFWDCYILFNFHYASETSIASVHYQFLISSVFFVITAGIFHYAASGRREVYVLGLALQLITLGILWLNPQYEHYYVIFAPSMIIPFICLDSSRIIRFIEIFLAASGVLGIYACMCIACVGGQYLRDMKASHSLLNPARYFRYDRGHVNEFAALAELIDDRDSVTMIGNRCMIYNRYGLRSPLRFVYQFPIVDISTQVHDEVTKLIESGKSRYLIIDNLPYRLWIGDPNSNDSINLAIHMQYEKIGDCEMYSLWRWRDAK